jgi:hypothetical protein
MCNGNCVLLQWEMISYKSYECISMILWYIHPLLGNDNEASNDTMTIARKQVMLMTTGEQWTVFSGSLCKKAISGKGFWFSWLCLGICGRW